MEFTQVEVLDKIGDIISELDDSKEMDKINRLLSFECDVENYWGFLDEADIIAFMNDGVY